MTAASGGSFAPGCLPDLIDAIRPLMIAPCKVLYLHHARILGGAEHSLLNLFRHLDRSRFEPMVACPDTGPFAETLREEGVEIFPMEYPRLRNLPGVLRTGVRVMALAKKLGVGILHGNTPRSNLPGAMAGWNASVPVVWHMRNLLSGNQSDIERWFWKWPARIVCNSEAIRRRFPVNERVLTILNGINLEEFHPGKSGRKVREELGIPMNAFVVSIMSRLAPEKGQRAFLRVARSLHREFPEMHFVVIGEAVPEEKPFELGLRREAEYLNGSATFTGFRKDMPDCFAASDAVVLASEAEPCGRVLFEALASGRPLVATNTGGTPEIVNDQESGFLFPPGDDERLADCLRRLYRDVELRRSMGAKGRSRAESEFSIQGHVRRIEALYEQVLQEAGK